MKRSLVAAVVLSAVVWIVATRTTAQTSQPAPLYEVRATRFVLTDSQGVPRAELTAESGGPKLAMYDSKGITRAAVAVVNDKPSVALFDDRGRPIAALNGLNVGPSLIMQDERGKIRTALSLTEAGPSLVLQDEKGVPRNQIGAVQVNVPGNPKAATPEASLRLADRDGNIVWSVP